MSSLSKAKSKATGTSMQIQPLGLQGKIRMATERKLARIVTKLGAIHPEKMNRELRLEAMKIIKSSR